jgi:hypothetical protein
MDNIASSHHRNMDQTARRRKKEMDNIASSHHRNMDQTARRCEKENGAKLQILAIDKSPQA